MDISGMTLKELVSNAYNLRDYQIIFAAEPKWVSSERYDVSAKDTAVQVADSRKLTGQEWSAALDADYEKLRSLLADRFQLRSHTESRQMPTYALIVTDPEKPHAAPCSDGYYLHNGMAKGQMKITSLVALLSSDMNRPVVDATGLKGCYDLDLKWTQDPNNEDLPSISTALHEIGLKMASRTGPVDVLVVDHAERPSPN
jgi:uncharacterized protein (TIGR03435 family)